MRNAVDTGPIRVAGGHSRQPVELGAGGRHKEKQKQEWNARPGNANPGKNGRPHLATFPVHHAAIQHAICVHLAGEGARSSIPTVAVMPAERATFGGTSSMW